LIEQRAQLAHRHRAAEQVALQVIAAVAGQELVLLDRFDAFADHFQVQGVGHGDDGLDDFAILGAGGHILQEAAVDLQHVQG